jgi:hypothetical protein
MAADDGPGVGVGDGVGDVPGVGLGDGVMLGVGVGVGPGCEDTDPQPTVTIFRNIKANRQSKSVGLNFKVAPRLGNKEKGAVLNEKMSSSSPELAISGHSRISFFT